MIGFEVAINSVFVFLTCAAVLVTRNGVVDEKFVVNFIFYVIFTPIIYTTFTKIMFMSENDMLVKDSLQRINELLNIEPLKKSDINNAKVKDYSVELKNVTYRYAGDSKDALSNLSLNVPSGKMAALIGPSGGGKSTTAALIDRFFDVTEGSIRIDGIDVRKFNLKALRKKIGFIRQKNLLFTGTIKSNIKFGKPHATHDEVEHSAKIAQAYDFITNKEKGFDEPISEGGSNVSGGQKQRLSIARALVRKPEIYIFDDSFSALDFKTDAILRKALKKETTDAIVLIVAQRIGSIMDADKIIVLDEGKVVGVGKHKELLKTCNVYHEIALSQLTEEELA